MHIYRHPHTTRHSAGDGIARKPVVVVEMTRSDLVAAIREYVGRRGSPLPEGSEVLQRRDGGSVGAVTLRIDHNETDWLDDGLRYEGAD